MEVQDKQEVELRGEEFSTFQGNQKQLNCTASRIWLGFLTVVFFGFVLYMKKSSGSMAWCEPKQVYKE